jgi:phosphoribosylaminoimidazole-succinocarboxamide synthase
MAKILENVKESALTELVKVYLKRISQGKVRNMFELPGNKDLLLILTTNRVSIFDFVLPFLVEFKGAVLNILTVFWLTEILSDFKHHLVAYGFGIDWYLPRELRRLKELQEVAIVVKRLDMENYEFIPRGYLTGTGLTSYNEKGYVCGIPLPPGLHDGSKIPGGPIITPTTKAVEGHDEHVRADSVDQKFLQISLDIYNRASEYTETKGIIIADTKLEFSKDGYLGDEVLTPDSSRFWSVLDYIKAQEKKKAPAGYDKQPLRELGKIIPTPFFNEEGLSLTGINNLKPEIDEHVSFVHGLKFPADVLAETSQRYQNILKMLIGMDFETAKKKILNIY